MKKSNLTYEQLIELAPKDRPFQIEVEEGIFWCFFDGYELDVKCDDHTNGYWEENYKGTFTLIDEYRNIYEKPEVLEVGTEVEILESARQLAISDAKENFRIIDKRLKTIGLSIIDKVEDNACGVYYFCEGVAFPHYCVRPIEKVEEKEDIITVNNKKYKLIKE